MLYLRILFGVQPAGQFTHDAKKALQNILTLADAHESKDEEGKYGEYVNPPPAVLSPRRGRKS